MDEVKAAVWDCGSQKALGSNGYSFMFIKKFWDLLKHDIQSFVVHFFSTEGLHMALNDGLAANMFHGIKVGSSGMHLSHLFYVDNVIILFEWNLYAMENIILILDMFYITFGLDINIHKYNVYGVGVSSNEEEIMASYTGCEAGFFPFTYLGLPIGSNMSRIANWQPLIDRLRLDYRLEGQPSLYWWLPYSHQICARSEDSKKLAWVKWSNILASLDKGGLGVGSLKAFNMSLFIEVEMASFS
ncbi:hypothetical protein Tco_0449550 [Tanacetum coccineum]